ncbi:ATP-binding protein [Granulicella sp. L46]|uniref:ATP-binding protein n=1 Tax=Granulicella sp. L46 TaxID=1641865 RepID=UPI00131C166E|nr:ATP-binding protein [Granulicella sp. L46]
MNRPRTTTLRTRLTVYYVAVLTVLLVVYAGLVFALQYEAMTRQMLHDEVQDVITVEGLLYFDGHNQLQLQQNYYSRPQSHLLVDRLMEVLDTSTGAVLYRSPTLHGMSMGDGLAPSEGVLGFNERRFELADGTKIFMVSHIHQMDGRTIVIRLGYRLDSFRSYMGRFLLLLLLAVPIALALAAAAGQSIARRALKPLDRMNASAESITAHNLHDRLDVANPSDELGQMATSFNNLLQRLEQAFFQLHRFTADAAHELRTPLSVVRATSEVALQEPRSTEEYRYALSSVLEESGRLNATIDSLLLLARAESAQPGEHQTVFPIKPLVDEVLGFLEILLEERDIRVVQEVEGAENADVLGDRNLLRVAFLNVLHNAIKFSPQQSVLVISYSRFKSSPQVMCITFHDQGPGIIPGEEERVFDRFFSRSETAAGAPPGAGLGLAIAKLVIERAGGNIRFDTNLESGAKCIVCLPVAISDSSDPGPSALNSGTA